MLSEYVVAQTAANTPLSLPFLFPPQPNRCRQIAGHRESGSAEVLTGTRRCRQVLAHG